MKIALVGATGLVGGVMLEVLGSSKLLNDIELIAVASERSVGKRVMFRGQEVEIVGIEKAIEACPEFAIFSAGSATSIRYAPEFAAMGTVVVDNSSAWRKSMPLVVPQINIDAIGSDDRIIANPNCSTIQMVMVLAPLHKRYGIKRVIVSTYQSVTGTGMKAVEQLMDERNGKEADRVYPHSIDLNLIPHGGDFLDNGYTSEEMKLVTETRKILSDDSLRITSTVVRVPVVGGHSEAVNVEFENDFELEEVKRLLSEMPGVVVMDDVENNIYPMPVVAHRRDEVFVGRIRRDESNEKSLNLWIVADNLRKGAATNAVEIVEYIVSQRQGMSVL